jgi:hypothetical protein
MSNTGVITSVALLHGYFMISIRVIWIHTLCKSNDMKFIKSYSRVNNHQIH